MLLSISIQRIFLYILYISSNTLFMQQQLTLSSTSYIQFKHINSTFETYLPKPKLISTSGELIINYVYKTTSVQSMGNLDDFVEGKEIGDADQQNKESDKVSKSIKIDNKGKQQKKAEIISESKKKGIKDYTISLHHKSQHPKPSTILFPTAFRPTKLLSYFQLKLIQSCEDPTVSMGITSSNNQQHLPLQSSSSKSIVSLYFNIISSNVVEVFRNGNKLEQIQVFGIKEGCYVGLGLVEHANQVFVTVDGVVCGRWTIFYSDLVEEKVGKGKNVTQFAEECTFKFYPFVTLTNKNIKVECIFENSLTNFKFDYIAYTQQLQQRVLEHEIPTQTEISQDFTYSLVLNYLKFHGHEKTSQIFENEMLKRNMKYYPQNQPLKNKTSPAAQQNIQQIGKQKKIRKRIKKGSARRTQDPSPSLPIQVEIEDEKSNNSNNNSNEQQPKNKEKDSSDSEQPIEQFLQLQGSSLLSRRGKLIEQGEEPEKEKKQQQQVHFVLNKKKMEKKVEELKRSQTQKLKIERVQIMKRIQEGQIEQALKLFSKFFKILHNREKHLQIFFKAHIFLKHYYKDGLQSALEYAKKQHKMFTLYENSLMPFYSQFNPGFTFRPLRQILFVICPQNHQNFNFQKQLSVFAEFISQTICQFYGYFGSSKLELVLGHYRVVRKIVAQSGVAVAGIEAQMDDQI